MSEPNSKFPKVSSCHRAFLGVKGELNGKYAYYCSKCRELCDAVSNAVKGANEDQRKLVEGLEEKRWIACENEKERNSLRNNLTLVTPPPHDPK